MFVYSLGGKVDTHTAAAAVLCVSVEVRARRPDKPGKLSPAGAVMSPRTTRKSVEGWVSYSEIDVRSVSAPPGSPDRITGKDSR